MPRLRHGRKVVVAVVGGTVLLFGVILVVLPGPGIVVIPAGLSILASEFVWAKRWLAKTRDFTSRLRAKKKPQENAETGPSLEKPVNERPL